MNLTEKNWLRKLVIPGVPDAGAWFYRFAKSIERQTSNTEQQGNLNPQGQPVPPPAIDGINVAAQNGHHTVTITDQNPGVSRGVNYWLERDTSPAFTNPHIIDLGQSRNHSEFLGSGDFFWRGYSSYSSSPPSAPAYHGSAAQPTPVNAGGEVGPPAQLASQGSGTGASGQGLQGPGLSPKRTDTSGSDWTLQRSRGGLGAPALVRFGSVEFGGAAPGSGGGGGSLPQILICTQATYPSLAGSGPIFVYVTDYAHLIFWNGTVGTFVGDNPGSLSLWENNPGTGYHLYDGATVNYLKADGTTGSVTLPDLTSAGALAAFLEGGSPNSGPTAATAPTFTGTPATPTGTVSAPAFTGNAATITTSTFTPVALATTAMTSLDGSTTSYTPSGTNSAPTFTGNSATPAGTVSATGEPRKIIRRPYFRM